MNHFDTLNPIDGRSVIRCHGCRLVQFKPAAPICRRCTMPLQPIPAHKIPNRTLPVTEYTTAQRWNPNWQQSIALAVRAMRLSAGLQIKELGQRMGSHRNYISRVEHLTLSPGHEQARKIAEAAGYSMTVLCDLAQAIHDSM